MKGKLFCYAFSTLLALMFVREECTAQQLDITQIEYNDDQVVIHYSLIDSTAGRLYVVRAYFSQDNFLTPLVNVGGDLGFEVRPGLNKKIFWNPKKELGNSFDGKVAVELRATVFVPFLNVNGIERYVSLSRGRSYTITWSGGSPQNVLNFELLQNNRLAASFPNVANVGHHAIKIPTNVRVGENYRLKVSDSKNPDEVVYTGAFSIRRRIPQAFKLAGGALLGAGIFVLTLKNTEPNLPGPISPK